MENFTINPRYPTYSGRVLNCTMIDSRTPANVN